MSSAYALSWNSVITFTDTLRSEVSAWAVYIKQTSVAAHQKGQVEITTKKQLANALGAISMSHRVIKTITSFDSELGQPESIKCIAQQNGKLHIEAQIQRKRDAGKLMESYVTGSIRSKATDNDEILTLHRDIYCTVSEAKQSMCSLSANGMQGWDINYAGAFSERTLAPEGELAAYAYAAMIAPSKENINSNCMTTACIVAQERQLVTSAISTMAINTFIEQATDRRIPILTNQ